jgi:hypothetical protein
VLMARALHAQGFATCEDTVKGKYQVKRQLRSGPAASQTGAVKHGTAAAVQALRMRLYCIPVSSIRKRWQKTA